MTTTRIDIAEVESAVQAVRAGASAASVRHARRLLKCADREIERQSLYGPETWVTEIVRDELQEALFAVRA